MGDMSLRLASECLKNSRDVMDELPKVELSQDMEKTTSALKGILEVEQMRQRSSKRTDKHENGIVSQPSMKVLIISERQFSCLRDLMKQSMEMIHIHLKQCQFNSMNNPVLSADQSPNYFKEEIDSEGVKLEGVGNKQLNEQEIQNLELDHDALIEQQDVELYNDINPVGFELYQSTFDGTNASIDDEGVLQTDTRDPYSDSLNPPRRSRKKSRIIETGDYVREKQKRKRMLKTKRKKKDSEKKLVSRDKSPTLALNYYQGNEEDLDFPLEDGNESKARERLKELIRMICLWPYGTEIPVDLDILHGQSPSHYGLNARGGGKPYIFELVMLSLESPIFLQRRTCVQFYSKLFRVPLRPWKIKIRNMYLFWERGGDLKTCDKYRFPCSSKVLKELILKGFNTFNPFTDADLHTYDDEDGAKSITHLQKPKEVKNFEDLFMCTPSSRLNCPAPNFFVAPKNRRHAHDGIETLAQTNTPVLDWLAENHVKEINVICRSRCYGQGAFFQQHVGLIPDFGLNHVFAIVAINVDDNAEGGEKDKDQEGNQDQETKEYCYHAKIFARSASSSNANPSEDFEDLYKVVIESLGLSYHDIFRNSYALPTTQSAKNLHDHYFKVPIKQVYANLESLGEEGVRKQVGAYNSEIERLSVRKPHITLVDLPQNRRIKLMLHDSQEDNSAFDFSRVNNISVLSGLDPQNIQVRSLLSEESYLASFSMKKSTATSADANEILPWVLMDLFCTFHGFTTHEIFDSVPEYEKKFTHLRDTYNKMRACKEILSRQNVVCQVKIQLC